MKLPFLNAIVTGVLGRPPAARPPAARTGGFYPAPGPMASLPVDEGPAGVGLARYQAALARLAPADREAIVARFELRRSYDQIALVLDKPSAHAARRAVTRALVRLMKELDHAR